MTGRDGAEQRRALGSTSAAAQVPAPLPVEQAYQAQPRTSTSNATISPDALTLNPLHVETAFLFDNASHPALGQSVDTLINDSHTSASDTAPPDWNLE